MRRGQITGIALLSIWVVGFSIHILTASGFPLISAFNPLFWGAIIGLIFLLWYKPTAKTADKANQDVKEDKETPTVPSFEAVAKQLRPAYCTKCGSRLQVRKLEKKSFDKDTGYPKCDVIIACPHATLYETRISRNPWVTWKAPFNRHTADKVSLIVYPQDKNV